MEHMNTTPDYFDIAMELDPLFAWHLKGCIAFWVDCGGVVPVDKICPQQIAKEWLETYHPEMTVIQEIPQG